MLPCWGPGWPRHAAGILNWSACCLLAPCCIPSACNPTRGAAPPPTRLYTLQGGYVTPDQASRSWLLSMTEWATQPLAGATSALWYGNRYQAGGLRRGAAAAHILVYDR